MFDETAWTDGRTSGGFFFLLSPPPAGDVYLEPRDTEPRFRVTWPSRWRPFVDVGGGNNGRPPGRKTRPLPLRVCEGALALAVATGRVRSQAV